MTTTAVLGVSQRIGRLRDRIMRRGGSFVENTNPFLRDVALWRAARVERSRVQIRAAFLKELVKLANIEIRPDWYLAGEHFRPGPAFDFAFRRNPDLDMIKRIHELGVAPKEVASVRDTVRVWTNGPWQGGRDSGCYAVGQTQAHTELARGPATDAKPTFVYTASGWIENHSVRDFAKVLGLGFRGIRREVEQQLANANVADKDYSQRENFLMAALCICDAGILLGLQYAELAAEMADKATDPDDESRLRQMAETCSRVPAEGARTFFEAVQSLWFAHTLTCGEDHINANSIGRLDQILYAWYEADVRAGRLTREQAMEIMEELACKLYLEYDVQAITLGGVDREGHDAVNDLSYIILEATRNLDFARDVSVRLHRKSPPPFVRLAAELIARGGGIPFIFNDDCFIKALSDRGIALEDARDYAPIGCIELTIPGRANPHAVSGWFNSAKCLELALFDGKDPRYGTQLGPQTGSLADLASYEDLFKAYCTQTEFFARQMVYHCNRGELAQRELGPLPCWSVLTDDCIQRGRDITDGGAVYNYHSICFLGTANTADSMMAIKRLIFEEKRIDPAQLLQALRDNYQGNERLRQVLLNHAPKYGNDRAEVDLIAARVAEQFIALMDTMESPLGGRYFVHLFSFLRNLSFGKAVGATPDGRFAGEPLAYSLSAHQGRDQRGITALLNSISRLPHDRAAGATAAIVEIDPVLIESNEGIQRLADMIRGAIDIGVGQLQWNVTTVERLLKAQQDPERYGNIVVRVAGYSQMFRLINKELQDHIIARTKHKH